MPRKADAISTLAFEVHWSRACRPGDVCALRRDATAHGTVEAAEAEALALLSRSPRPDLVPLVVEVRRWAWNRRERESRRAAARPRAPRSADRCAPRARKKPATLAPEDCGPPPSANERPNLVGRDPCRGPPRFVVRKHEAPRGAGLLKSSVFIPYSRLALL